MALALAACPSAKQTPVAPPTPATPVQVVAAGRALVEEWRQAYEGKSFDALAKLYARGPELVVVQDGLPLIGWSSVDAMLRDRLARAKQVVVRVKDVQVTAIAPTAASASGSEPLRVSWPEGEPARHNGSATGISISPAPCAPDIRNDQSHRPRAIRQPIRE